MIELGKTYRDLVTGFTGVCMGITQYLTGCDRIGLLSTTLKDGKPLDWMWYDSSMLEEVEDVDKISPKVGFIDGGPQANAPQR